MKIVADETDVAHRILMHCIGTDAAELMLIHSCFYSAVCYCELEGGFAVCYPFMKIYIRDACICAICTLCISDVDFHKWVAHSKATLHVFLCKGRCVLVHSSKQ